jgi:hypothetical protein
MKKKNKYEEDEEVRKVNQREIIQLLKKEKEEYKPDDSDNMGTAKMKEENQTQYQILETLKEFKFEYLENEEKARREKETLEEPIDIRDEFRVIHSKNIVTMKRMMSDTCIDIIRPIQSIQERFERNLTDIPTNTRKIIREMKKIKKEARGMNTLQIMQNEVEKDKLDNLTKLSTLNLMQGNEMESEIKLDLEEIKGTIKEIHQKVIEYGIVQEESKEMDVQKKEKRIKKEKKESETPKVLQEYKPKRTSSESSSS